MGAGVFFPKPRRLYRHRTGIGPAELTILSTPSVSFTEGVVASHDMAQHFSYTGSDTLTSNLIPTGPHPSGIGYNGWQGLGNHVLSHDGTAIATSYSRSLSVTDGTVSAESAPFNIVVNAAAAAEVTFPDLVTYFATSETVPGPSTFAHTVTPGTTMLLIATGMRANEELVSAEWNSAPAALVADLDDSGSSGAMVVELWGIVNPTPATGNVAVDVSTGSFDACHWIAALNVHGTTEASLAAAVQLLSSDFNNAVATNTSVHAIGGTAGNKLLFVGGGLGDDSSPASNDAVFAELLDDNTGGGSTAGADISAYIAEGDAPSAVTVTFGATAQNVGGLFELVAGGTPPPPTEASFGVEQGDPGYLPIIPGIRGFGTETEGGSGRHLGTPATTVLYVDTLSSGTVQTGANSGSLLWCMNRPFPRTVIPAISGLIEFPSQFIFTITNPFLTYSGQCAPGLGLHTYSLQIQVRANDVFIHHLSNFRENGNAGPGNQTDLQIGGGTGIYERIVVANPNLIFGWDEGYSVFCNSTSKVLTSTIWQPIVGMGQWDGSAFGSLIDFGTASGGPFAHSCIRPIFIKNRRRSWKGVDGRCEVVNSWGYDNDFNHELQCHQEPTTTFMSVRGVAAARGPNALDQINSFLQINPGFEGAHQTGGYYHMSGNRRFSDYVTAEDFNNPTGETNQATPHAFSVSPGIVVRPIADNDAAIIEFAELMATHCGSRPANRLPYVQNIIDEMLQYLNGTGVDTVPRIGNPDEEGWPIAIASTTIDHTAGGAHNGDPIPTTNFNEIMPSGYTRGEEWTHRRNGDHMPAGWDR